MHRQLLLAAKQTNTIYLNGKKVIHNLIEVVKSKSRKVCDQGEMTSVPFKVGAH